MNPLCTRITVLIVLSSLLLGCEDPFDYSPYTIEPNAHQLTAKNLARLEQTSLPQFVPFRFALASDTHAYYDELDKLVETLNRRNDIDFLLIAGDLTDYGLQQEYQWQVDLLQRLAIPYLTVIGNHDAINNGKENYRAFFGEFDYSFVFNQVKIVALNSNSWEFDNTVPRLDWLEAELKDFALYQHQIILTHHLPQNDRFTPQQSLNYLATVKRNFVSLMAGGHYHGMFFSQEILSNGQTISYLAPGTLKDRTYMVISVEADQIRFEREFY